MSQQTESFWEHLQERLLDAHSKHEDNVDKLVRYIENELDLTEQQRKDMDELMENVYATLNDLRFEII